MSLSSEDIRKLGEAHHRGDAVACPICTSRLDVHNRGYAGRVSVPLRLVCPRHGIIGEFDPPDLRTPWPKHVILQLLADHLRHGKARCPEDLAVLGVIHIPHEKGEYLCLACPSCGRTSEGEIDSDALERLMSGVPEAPGSSSKPG